MIRLRLPREGSLSVIKGEVSSTVRDIISHLSSSPVLYTLDYSLHIASSKVTWLFEGAPKEKFPGVFSAGVGYQ